MQGSINKKTIEEKFKNLPQGKLGEERDVFIKAAIYRKMEEKAKRVNNKFTEAKKVDSFLGCFFAHKYQKVFVSAFILFALSLGFVPSYAYASKKVIEGHVLYPVKKIIENVELTLTQDKSEKLLKFSLRRLEEAEVLATKDENEKGVKELINNAMNLKEEALQIKEETEKDAIVEYNDKGLSSLKEVAKKVGVDSSDEVLDTVALTIDDFKKNETGEDVDRNKVESGKKQIRQEVKEKEIVKEETGKEAEERAEEKNDVNESIEFKKASTTEEKIKNSNEKAGKNKEINTLKREVKELEKELTEDNYNEDQVEVLMEKLNNRIEKAEKETNKKKSDEIIKPTKALKDNAKYFVEKEDSLQNEEDEGSDDKKTNGNSKSSKSSKSKLKNK